MDDLDTRATELRRHGFHVVNRCFYAPRGWLVRRFPELKGVWVYPQGERWRLHLAPYGTGLHWVRDVDDASLEAELERALTQVHESECPDGWELGLSTLIAERLHALPVEPVGIRRVLEDRTSSGATPWQHAPGLLRVHLAGQFEDAASLEYHPRFGIAAVPTEAGLVPVFEGARAYLEERLGSGEAVSYGLRWIVGDFVVALLHTDAIGDGHLGEGRTVEVRVFDPLVVPDPTRHGFAWPEPDERDVRST
ncbi:MAG: hypothetical protein H6723_02640 [Sandaracinus sp.]|nr:hypothetical protein [Sandaracinus sp.]